MATNATPATHFEYHAAYDETHENEAEERLAKRILWPIVIATFLTIVVNAFIVSMRMNP